MVVPILLVCQRARVCVRACVCVCVILVSHVLAMPVGKPLCWTKIVRRSTLGNIFKLRMCSISVYCPQIKGLLLKPILCMEDHLKPYFIPDQLDIIVYEFPC